MKRGIKRLIALVAVAFLFVPTIVQWAFRTSALVPFLVAEWTAGEFLDYVGSIIGAVATIAAVRMTIQFEREERIDDQRLSVLPLIAVTRLERHVPNLDSVYMVASRPNRREDAAKADTYSEFSPGKEYIVISNKGEITYSSKLSEGQAHLAYGGDFLEENMGNGLIATVLNKSLYYPLLLQSAGNGPAINVSVWMQKDGRGPKYEGTDDNLHLPIVQLTVGESRYVDILFEDWLAEGAKGRYELVVAYHDTFGNKYYQIHELALAPMEADTSSSSTHKFELKIDQIRAF